MTEVGLMEDARILVVEDEAIVSADIEMKLEHLGYKVAGVATSGAVALEKAREVHPNLALMDIHLDGNMDGVETAQALKDRLCRPDHARPGQADPAVRIHRQAFWRAGPSDLH
jgi:CheY-like chemotaxis protein